MFNIFITAFLLFANNASAQGTLIGDGSPSNPYKISSAADWDRFTEIIDGTNGATKQPEACAIMTDNVPNAAERANGIKGVTTMVTGIYKGTFNGAGHTLTVNYGTENDRVEVGCPFYVCINATVKYLHVDGNIFSRDTRCNSLAYYAKDCNITSYWSSICFNSNGCPTWFVGDSKETKIQNCLFDGELTNNNQQQYYFAFSSYGNTTISNCLINPRDKTTKSSIVSDPQNFTITNCYYLGISDSQQGTDASSMSPQELADALGSAWRVDENNNVVPVMDITNLNMTNISLPEIISWTGEPITLDYKVTDFEGNELTDGVHYTAAVTTKDGKPVTEIIDDGDYRLILTATTDGGYTGQKTQDFSVGDGLSKDENGNYYIIMPTSGTKTVMPRGKENGFVFTIHNPDYPESFYGTSNGSIIINAQGYTMSMDGYVSYIYGNTTNRSNLFFEVYNGTKTDNSTPAPTNILKSTFTSEGSLSEIYFISKTNHDAEKFHITVTLTAIEYNISYSLNGGTVNEEDLLTKYTTDMDVTPVEPAREEGYVFGGWYTDENFSGSPIKSLRGLVGDKTFYARWKKSLVTYPTISISTPEDVTYNGSAFTPTITVKDGETDITSECEITYTDNINVGTATVTITAKAESNEYAGSVKREFTINPAPITATDDISINSNVKIWSFEKTIFVENASKEIVIVDMAGRVVKTVKPENSRIEIQLSNSGVYIVKTGLKTQKIIIQ